MSKNAETVGVHENTLGGAGSANSETRYTELGGMVEQNKRAGDSVSPVETRYTELAQTGSKGKRGPKPSPDAQTKKTVSLRPSDWAFVERWAYEGDYSDKEESEKHWNPSPAFGRCLEDARRMFPLGPLVGRPRGEGGRFVGDKPSPVRATRPQLQARIKALENRLRAAGLEVE